MPKFNRSRAPERIDAAISHSTWVGLRPIVSLILGASTPSISQTLNIKVKAIVDRVRTVQREAWRSGGGAEPMEGLSWRGMFVRASGPERSPPPGRCEGVFVPINGWEGQHQCRPVDPGRPIPTR